MPARIKVEDKIDLAQEVKSMDLELDLGLNESGDDDVVVREIDVFLSPALAQQLFLLQYPLQHQAVTPPVAARIKPRHNLLELDHPLPQMPDGSLPGSGFQFSQRSFESQTIPIQTHMCLGKIQTSVDTSTGQSNSALHLVPLTHISQMRPTFRHVDEATSVPGAMDSAAADQMDIEQGEEDQEKKAAEKKPVIFQRKESERAAVARRSSFAYKKASEELEAWQDLTIHASGVPSAVHKAILKQVYSHDSSNRVVAETNVDDEAFVKTLNYLPAAIDDSARFMFAGLDRKSIAGRLVLLMRRGGPMPYSILRSQFDDKKVNDTALLSVLSVCAVLVQGNFLLHSRFLSLPKYLQAARTFVLYLLERFGTIERARLFHVFKHQDQVSEEALIALLKQVAKKIDRGWILKISEDPVIAQIWPDETEPQRTYWVQQDRRFGSWLYLYSQ